MNTIFDVNVLPSLLSVYSWILRARRTTIHMNGPSVEPTKRVKTAVWCCLVMFQKNTVTTCSDTGVGKWSVCLDSVHLLR